MQIYSKYPLVKGIVHAKIIFFILMSFQNFLFFFFFVELNEDFEKMTDLRSYVFGTT